MGPKAERHAQHDPLNKVPYEANSSRITWDRSSSRKAVITIALGVFLALIATPCLYRRTQGNEKAMPFSGKQSTGTESASLRSRQTAGNSASQPRAPNSSVKHTPGPKASSPLRRETFLRYGTLDAAHDATMP